jgi:hypothetical protein
MDTATRADDFDTLHDLIDPAVDEAVNGAANDPSGF